MADFIKREAGIDVALDSKGKIGELTVWVDGKKVTEKGFFKFPEKENVLAAIQKEINP